MKTYYVYTHSDLQGNVFYVGKGTARRAWSKTRNDDWQKKVDAIKNYVVNVQFDNLSEEEAFDCESVLIDFYGLKNLTNRKSEWVKKSNQSLEWYKVYQYAKDIVWLKENLDKIDYKNKFIKEQLQILTWIEKMRLKIQRELKLLYS